MGSVGITEEEGKFNKPVPEPHILTSSSSPPPFLAHVSSPSANIGLVSENDGIEAKNDGPTETVHQDKGGKYTSSYVGGIRGSLTLKALH